MSSTYKVDSDVGVNVRDTPNGNRVGGLMNGTQVTKLDDDPVDAGGEDVRAGVDGAGGDGSGDGALCVLLA